MATKVDLLKAIGAYEIGIPVSIPFGDSMIELKVSTSLPGDKKVDFVQFVSDYIIRNSKRCFALYNFAFKKATIRYLTDFNVTLSDVELEILFDASDLFAAIQDKIPSLLQELDDACRAQIKAAQKSEIAIAAALIRPDPLDRIADMLEGFFESMTSTLGPIDVKDIGQVISMLKTANNAGDIVEHILASMDKEGDNGAENATEPADFSGVDRVD